MLFLRSFTLFILATLVGITSQELAIARGQPTAQGQIELCAGTQVVIISVDENGEPVEPGHICPDALIAFLHILNARVHVPVPDFLEFSVTSAHCPTGLCEKGELSPSARGPPRFV